MIKIHTKEKLQTLIINKQTPKYAMTENKKSASWKLKYFKERITNVNTTTM